MGLFEADGFNLKKLVYGAFICLAKRGSFFPCKCLRPSKKRREWEIVVFPYTELQRDYRFNVKLAGSLIASPIGIKVHTVSPPKRGVAISHHSTGVSCQSCLNFSMARDLATTMPAAKWTETVESVKKKN